MAPPVIQWLPLFFRITVLSSQSCCRLSVIWYLLTVHSMWQGAVPAWKLVMCLPSINVPCRAVPCRAVPCRAVRCVFSCLTWPPA
jgi:hypothetical protein